MDYITDFASHPKMSVAEEWLLSHISRSDGEGKRNKG